MMKEFKNKRHEVYFRLCDEIEVFKRDFQSIVDRGYIDDYMKGFNNYLLALDYLEKDTAEHIVKLARDIASGYATINTTDLEIGTVYMATEELLQINITDSEIEGCILDFILAKEPERFSHSPRRDEVFTKTAQDHWRTNIVVYSYKLANEYLQRSLNIDRDIVMRKYHQLREKNDGIGGVKKSHEELIIWIESYGETIQSIGNKIKLQLFEQDSFNQAYIRWKKDATHLS